MKNLKRVLSLALSGVMLVGMMAVSAGAVNAEDFTDADEITHNEAVSISTALKIIDGKEDGSFDPNGNVTRGQMAKMITRAMFGGDDPVLGLPGTPTFSDIKGRWDETYIEYCANNTIINGRGDGTFDPEGNVTGTEAAKMLLTALGYKADIYGLVGPDWALTTNSIANQTKVNLYDGLKGLDPSKAFTRDQVAQMIYNALNVETLEMMPDMSITNGQVTYKYQPSGRSLLYDKYGAVRVEGVVTGNSFSNNSQSMKGKTALTVTNAAELNGMLGAGTITAAGLEVESGKEVFGRNVVLYVKPSAANKLNLSKGTVISEVILDVDAYTEYTTTSGFNASETDKLSKWIDNKGFSGVDGSASYYLNYNLITSGGTPDRDSVFGATPTDYVNTRGTEIIVIDNDQDGDVDRILMNTSEFGQVTKWNTKDKGSVTVKTAENIHNFSNKELAEVVAYDDIAVNDYVNVTKVSDTWYVTKAEKIEGELEYYKKDGVKTTIKVNGETYNTVADAKAYAGTADLDGIRSDIAIKGVEDENVTIYLDAFGYAVAGTTDAATEFLFVGATSWSNIAQSQNNGTLTAYVYLSDGSSASYVVNKIDNAKATAGDEDTIHGGVYKYSITTDGKLNLTTVASAALGGTDANSETIKYNKTLSTLQIASDPKTFVTEDTVIFMVTLDSKADNTADVTVDNVKVYTEKTAPSMDYAADAAQSGAITNNDADDPEFYPGVLTVAALDDDGAATKNLDVVVFVNNGTSVDNDWIYLIDYAGSVGKGTMYNAVVNGEVVTITTDSKDDRVNLTVPGAFKYSENDGIYSIGTAYTHVQIGEVTLTDRTSVVLDNNFEAKVTSDTVVALLDGEDTEVDYKLGKGDVVAVVHDNGSDIKEAKGIFVLAAYDDTAAKVVATGTGVTKSGNDYTVPSGTNTVAGIKALFTVSGGATMKVVETAPTSSTNVEDLTEIASGEEATKCADGNDVYLVVISASAEDDSTDYTVYKVSIDS